MLIPKLSQSQRTVALKRFTDEGMILRTYDYDEAAQRHVIFSTQDIEPILKRNKMLFDLGDGYGPTREWKRAASVPNLIIEQWMKKGINAYKEDDQPKILYMLDSPECLALRTAPGRLSRRPYRCYFKASTPTGTRRVRPRGRIRLATS